MTNIFIKPASIEIDGEIVTALVRDPLSWEPLAADGELKTRSQYWTRRLRDGDVVEAEPTAAAAAPEAEAPASFAACTNCVTPDACAGAVRCVKAPLA